MQTFPNALRSILTVFWIGGLWVIGLLVGPLLFQQLDNNLAYRMVAVMFRAMAWVGIVAGIYIVFHILWDEGLRAFQTLEFWLILGMLILTLVNHFAVFPVISEVKPQMHTAAEGVFGGGFQSWQTISSLIYLIQSVLGLVYVTRGAVK
ncbi:DUF4149 domain-containing protein [Chitinimonas viridis]|uniref:DUF4149 domain-containing protein n=2 Tax=Chitinimonas TaxID=240411 RepID=A0ABT8B476_9NEIS|nr:MULTISPECIES: DUF4149 domain-containing protein [Chitinimonas]MDN3576625.1 DUF4149 domain-containing protein [Chitinimonas viridis]GLR11561.1 hypothetical protein GCM10007907_03510 [Chitinimonas prasina]